MESDNTELELFFLEQFESEIKKYLPNLTSRFFDGSVKVAQIKPGEVEKIKKSKEYKDGNLVLGRLQVWHRPSPEIGVYDVSEEVPYLPIEHIRFPPSKHFENGVVVTPYDRVDVKSSGGKTIDERQGVRRLQYDGTILGAFSVLYEYATKMGKIRDSETKESLDIVVYRSAKTRKILSRHESEVKRRQRETKSIYG